MTPPRLSLDDEILDLAVMWLPIGDPPADKIKRDFGVEPAEYRARLARAIDSYLQTSNARTAARLDRFFETSMLTALRPKQSPPGDEQSGRNLCQRGGGHPLDARSVVGGCTRVGTNEEETS